jgi:hypothetical protein
MTKAETIRGMFDDDGSVETYPYTVELAALAEDLIDGMAPGIEFTMATIWDETTEALFKFTFEDESQLFLSAYGPEYGLDAYTYTVHVVADPQKWLADQVLSIGAELNILSATLEQMNLALAFMQGKLIRMVEMGNDETTIRYLTEEEFLAEYREYYEGRLIEHYRVHGDGPTAEEYLDDLKAGKADQVINKWYVKMTAEWMRGELCRSSN